MAVGRFEYYIKRREEEKKRKRKKTGFRATSRQIYQLLAPLRRFFPLLESLPPCPFAELGDFPFAVLSGTLAESLEFSLVSSFSFIFDEAPDFTLPVPLLALDLPPLFGFLPLEMGALLGVSCLDFPVFAISCLGFVEAFGVPVSSSLDLPVLGMSGSLFLDFPANLGAASTDLLLPLLGA
jgi:hypothetical protein